MGLIPHQLSLKENELTLGSTKIKHDEINDLFTREESKEEEIINNLKINSYDTKGLNDIQKSKNGDMKNNKGIFIIPFLHNMNQEQKTSNLSISLDAHEQNPNYDSYPLNSGEHSAAKKSEEEKYGEEPKEETIMDNLFPKKKKSKSKLLKNLNTITFPKIKRRKARSKSTKKDLNGKMELSDISSLLQPKYEKGIQVILRRLDCGSMKGRFLLWNNIGHIFVRYFNKSKGIDKVIESVYNQRINEIRFYDFRKDIFIKRYTYYKIILEEKLYDNQNYEMIKNVLIKKYTDKNGVINRGKYSVLKNCCYDTVEEVLILFNKSPEAVKKLHSEFFLPTFRSIRRAIWA